ncbi:hypothetical protein KR222_004145, partial [Zaprionus bogoriensis]
QYICYPCVWGRGAVLQISGHCLRAPPQAVEPWESGGSTRHMWQQQQQQRPPTGTLADSGSCNRPTTLRPATDSNVASAQLTSNATVAAAAPAVTLANYVYQCAAKREPSPSKPGKSSRELAMSQVPLPGQQQMTVPDIVLQLARSWRAT